MKRREFIGAGLVAPFVGQHAAGQNRPAVTPSGPLRLENEQLAATFLPIDASLARVQNKLTGESHEVSGTTFVLQTDHGELTPGTMKMVRADSGAGFVEAVFERGPLEVSVRYELEAGQHFLHKSVSMRNNGRDNILITEVTTDRLRFTPAFLEAYAHDDGTDWKCPINLFLRTQKGGLFAGIENPYFEMVVPGAWKATRLDLRYSPRWILAPGETFASEPSFLGVYKKENVYFFREMQAFAYMTQKQIVLDWGEVWAMQAFLSAIQPRHELPYPGYYLRANCVDFFTELGRRDPSNPTPFGQPAAWWPPHSHAKFEPAMVAAGKFFVDRVKKQGFVNSIDWGTIWLGNAAWCRESPGEYLERLPESWPIEANPYWKEVIEYARKQGLGTGIMDEGGARDYLKHEKKWKVLGKDGEPIRGFVQLEGLMGRNCWANPAFARWWVNIVSRAIQEYDVPIWGTDAGSIWWVPFDPPLECHAPNHGHPVGECGYYAWRNIMWASAELQRRHPKCALRNAGGMHRGYPWVLKDWVEFHPYLDPIPMTKGGNITDNVRFQTWHTYNTRFIPVYKTGSASGTGDRYGMAYGMFSHLTRGDHGMAQMVPPWGVNEESEQEKHLAFWRKWAKWADDNVRFFAVRRDILGEPRLTGLDGSAHCIGDRGFLIVFNPTQKERAARIPLNEWIGLSKGNQFALKEIYPAESASYGIYARGDELVAPVASHDVLVVTVEPAGGSEAGRRPAVAAETPVDKAFLNAAELRAHLGVPVSIPGEAPPPRRT